jgi:hypothetical protein
MVKLLGLTNDRWAQSAGRSFQELDNNALCLHRTLKSIFKKGWSDPPDRENFFFPPLLLFGDPK